MPWKGCNQVDERLRFVARLLDGQKMATACREFGISRKTGYKIVDLHVKLTQWVNFRRKSTVSALLGHPSHIPNGPLSIHNQKFNPLSILYYNEKVAYFP
jgi:hypothetical protein